MFKESFWPTHLKKKIVHKSHLFLNQTYLREMVSDKTAYGCSQSFSNRLLNCHTFFIHQPCEDSDIATYLSLRASQPFNNSHLCVKNMSLTVYTVFMFLLRHPLGSHSGTGTEIFVTHNKFKRDLFKDPEWIQSKNSMTFKDYTYPFILWSMFLCLLLKLLNYYLMTHSG